MFPVIPEAPSCLVSFLCMIKYCVFLGEFYRTRLSRRHLILTSYSKMSVELAAQTLSKKIARSMEEYPDEVKREEMVETAKYIRIMDRWFDCMNTRLGKGKQSINVFRFNTNQVICYFIKTWSLSENEQRYIFYLGIFA